MWVKNVFYVKLNFMLMLKLIPSANKQHQRLIFKHQILPVGFKEVKLGFKVVSVSSKTREETGSGSFTPGSDANYHPDNRNQEEPPGSGGVPGPDQTL